MNSKNCWCCWLKSQTGLLRNDKKFNAIIRAEKASQRATKARQDAARLINEENRATAKAERTARHMSFVILRGCLSWRVWSIPKQASQQSIKANYWGRCLIYHMLTGHILIAPVQTTS